MPPADACSALGLSHVEIGLDAVTVAQRRALFERIDEVRDDINPLFFDPSAKSS